MIRVKSLISESSTTAYSHICGKLQFSRHDGIPLPSFLSNADKHSRPLERPLLRSSNGFAPLSYFFLYVFILLFVVLYIFRFSGPFPTAANTMTCERHGAPLPCLYGCHFRQSDKYIRHPHHTKRMVDTPQRAAALLAYDI